MIKFRNETTNKDYTLDEMYNYVINIIPDNRKCNYNPNFKDKLLIIKNEMNLNYFPDKFFIFHIINKEYHKKNNCIIL